MIACSKFQLCGAGDVFWYYEDRYKTSYAIDKIGAFMNTYDAKESLQFKICDAWRDHGTSRIGISAYSINADYPHPIYKCPKDKWDPSGSRLHFVQKYHSYIDWIFPVREHQKVLQVFNGHACQVTTISHTQINVPLDGYRKCATRRVLTTTKRNRLADRVPPAGTYSKNELIRYAIDDAKNKSCFRFPGIAYLLSEAYRTLNNTFQEVCNDGHTDSLLLDRRVDFVLGGVDRINPGSYYGYVTMPLESLCFLTRQQGPIAPSFASTWMSFFAIFLIFTPLALVATFILSNRYQQRERDLAYQSDLILFFLSTYLGRCPPPQLGSIPAPVRVASVAWMFGTFFLLQFTQTHLTASHNVPSHSPQIRRVAELVSRLGDGSIAPCLQFTMLRIIENVGGSTPYIESIRQVVHKCGNACLSQDIGGHCMPRVLNGAHVRHESVSPFDP
ncbi:hypothetical protein MTO96_035317 [Rhipicephalus appendiculatus]